MERILAQAVKQMESGSYDAARSIVKLAFGVDADSVPAHVVLGRLERLAGDLGASERAYRRALELDETSAEAHLELGNLAFRDGRDEEALARYRAYLIHVDPRRPGAEETGRRVRELIEALRERIEERKRDD